jgi:hypothetical protein
MRVPVRERRLNFERVEFPSLEIEFVPTKELLRRVKEMERREMELIRMLREAEKVDHETEERWKGMVKFVEPEIDVQQVDEMVNEQQLVNVRADAKRAAEGDVTGRNDKM